MAYGIWRLAACLRCRKAKYHHRQRRNRAGDKDGEWLLALSILAGMPDDGAAQEHRLQRRSRAGEWDGEEQLALGLLAEMTKWTVQQNTIANSSAIMLATGVANGSLHLASGLKMPDTTVRQCFESPSPAAPRS